MECLEGSAEKRGRLLRDLFDFFNRLNQGLLRRTHSELDLQAPASGVLAAKTYKMFLVWTPTRQLAFWCVPHFSRFEKWGLHFANHVAQSLF